MTMDRNEESFYNEIFELEQKIKDLQSNNEDLKYHFLALLQDYGNIVSQEGYGNKNDIEAVWMNKIKFLNYHARNKIPLHH